MTLDQIRALCEAVTPGPWNYCYDGSSTWSVGPKADPQCPQVASLWRPASPVGADCPDAAFIAAARELVPKLLAVAEAADSLLADARNDVSHLVVAQVLAEALAALEAP